VVLGMLKLKLFALGGGWKDWNGFDGVAATAGEPARLRFLVFASAICFFPRLLMRLLICHPRPKSLISSAMIQRCARDYACVCVAVAAA